jgi:hypothetical protein
MLRVLLPLLAMVASWQVWDNFEARRLESDLAKVVAASTATRSDDLPRSRSDEAGRYYAAAVVSVQRVDTAAALGDPVAVERDALSRGGNPSEAALAAVASVVAVNEWPLRLLDLGSDLPFRGFDPAREVSQRGYGLILLSRAAAYRTLDLVQRNDTDGAVDSVIARIQLLRAFDDDGIGLGATERALEVQGIASDIAIILGRARLPVSRIEELDRVLAAASTDRDLARVYARMAMFLHDFARSAGAGRSWQYGRGGFVLRPIFIHHVRGVMRTTSEALDAARLPWPERLRAIDGLTDSRTWMPMPTPIPAAAWEVADRFQELAVVTGEALAAVRAARLALKLEFHRQLLGALAARLDDVPLLVDDDAADPFAGERLRYVSQDGGFVVYSVGRDGRDDGGHLTPEQVKGRRPGAGIPKDVGVRVSYRRAALTNPSNSARNSPVR